MFPYFKKSFDTSPEMALMELKQLAPRSKWEIDVSDKRVKIRRNGQLETNRPTLHEAMNTMRWFYEWMKNRKAANAKWLHLITK